MSEFAKTLLLGLEKHPSGIALATLVKVKGSVPQGIGAKMLVSPEGRFWGTIGGGTIEKLVIEDAKKCLKKGQPVLKKYVLTDDDTKEDSTGMLCGGETEIFIDILGQPKKAFVFGGGHISQELVPILKKLDFSVTVVENREEYAKKELSNADDYLVGEYSEIIDGLDLPQGCYVVIMTYSHALDEKILEKILRKYSTSQPWDYLGMIGSKAKVKEIFRRLMDKGLSKELLDTVHSPIGVPIASHTPIEIAVSISAEIIKEKNSKKRES